MKKESVPLTFSSWDEDQAREINEQLATEDTLAVLRWAYENYGDELVYSCSFGAEGIVLIDLISRVRPNASILFLDTSFHFPETLALIDQVQKKYPELRINRIEPSLTKEQQAEQYGDKLWEKSPDVCCRLRKVEPLSGELKGIKAWISGLRREQSASRAQIQFVNIDTKFESIKICPLIHWKWEEIRSYISLYQLPYNPLHDQGYPSIGCATCTLPVAEGEDARAGRWTGSNKTECGLHQG